MTAPTRTTRTTRLRKVAAGACVAVGLAALAGELTLWARDAGLSPGPVATVNRPAPSTAHNSPTVAVHPRDPRTVVVANRLDAPQLGCALSLSANGGGTWRSLERTAGLAAVNCFWPRVAFTPDGTLLVLYTPLGGFHILPVGLELQRYEPDGATGGPPGAAGFRPSGPPVTVAAVELAFWARMAVVGQQVWVSWVQADPATVDNPLGLAPGTGPGANPVVVAASADGGRTFGPPRPVSRGGPLRLIQPTVMAWTGGGLFLGALDLVDDRADYDATHDGETPPDPRLRWRVVGFTSGDGGQTWAGPVVVGADLVPPQLILADLGPTPGFARDPTSGRLYAAWDAGRGDARDVSLAWSDDGGHTWSRPTTVGPTLRSQVLPAVGVAPDGRVDLVFYDRSGDPDDRFSEVVVASSWDRGSTFTTARVPGVPFDSRVGLGSQQGVPVQGDHLAVLSQARGPLAFWASTVRANPMQAGTGDNVQDLESSAVTARAARATRPPVLATGALLLLVGTGTAVGLRRGG